MCVNCWVCLCVCGRDAVLAAQVCVRARARVCENCWVCLCVGGGRDAVLAQALFHAIAGPDADFLEAMPEPEIVEDGDAPDHLVDLFQPQEVCFADCSMFDSCPHAPSLLLAHALMMLPASSSFPAIAFHTVKCKTYQKPDSRRQPRFGR